MKTMLFAPLTLALLFGAVPVTHAGAPIEAAAPAADEEKVVYHINDSENAMVALRNVQNHLNASKDVRIVVVTHGKGIDFLLNLGARTRTATLRARRASAQGQG